MNIPMNSNKEKHVTNGSANGTEKESAKKKLDPEMVEKISAIRTRIHSTFGQVVIAMTAVPRYRHQSVADLTHMVMEPLIRDRVAIASPKTTDENPAPATLAGIAIWASVSEDVNSKIQEQIKSGTFPIRLKADDWTSGDITWLLDVIAPSQKLSTAVLANFRQVVKEGQVRIHPLVAKMVDPELLKKMGAAPVAAPKNEEQLMEETGKGDKVEELVTA